MFIDVVTCLCHTVACATNGSVFVEAGIQHFGRDVPLALLSSFCQRSKFRFCYPVSILIEASTR